MTLQVYYRVSWRDDPANIGLARPTDEGSEFDRFIMRRKRRAGVIEEWVEQDYALRGAGGFADYQPEVRGLRLCSERFRELLERSRGPRDVVQWLPAKVADKNGETRPYWILHFPETTEDLLDVDRTRYGPLDEVVRGVIDARRAAGHHLLAPPDGFHVSFVVSAESKAKIDAAGLIGLDITEYPTTLPGG